MQSDEQSEMKQMECARDRLMKNYKKYLATKNRDANHRTKIHQIEINQNRNQEANPRPSYADQLEILHRIVTCKPHQSEEMESVSQMANMEKHLTHIIWDDGTEDQMAIKTQECSSKIENKKRNMIEDIIWDKEITSEPCKTNGELGGKINSTSSFIEENVRAIEDEQIKHSQIPNSYLTNQNTSENWSGVSQENDKAKESHAYLKHFTDSLHIGEVFVVRMSEVRHSVKFWLNIRQEKYRCQLKNLIMGMHLFYDANENSPELRVQEVESKQQYLALQGDRGSWYRVIPIGLMVGSSIRVSFVDHGSHATVDLSQLRHLPKQFWKTPNLTLCCTLGPTRTIGCKFTGRSADEMINLIGGDNKQMYARIKSIKPRSKSKTTIGLILDDKIWVNTELMRPGCSDFVV